MNEWIVFILLFLACSAAATTGAAFKPDTWYRQLSKPKWTPPDWLFPIAWTVLYFAMAGAGMRIAGTEAAGIGMALWSLQIALNTLWTPIFFGLRRVDGGLLVIFFLWSAVTAATAFFWVHDRVAGALFTPYWVWVSYAGALNFAIWRLNPTVTSAPVAATASGPDEAP